MPEGNPRPEARRPVPPAPEDDLRVDGLGHPRGTLVIVLIFGLLFGLGWIAMYVFGFLERGAPRP